MFSESSMPVLNITILGRRTEQQDRVVLSDHLEDFVRLCKTIYSTLNSKLRAHLGWALCNAHE